MSSHHFVKEGQEPSLFILDPLSQSHADSFLEWSPLVMVHEKAVDEVLLWGIKLDVVLAHVENVKALSERLIDQSPVKIVADSNPNDLTSALWLLVTLKQSSVYIMVKDPISIFNNPNLPVNQLQVNLVTENIKWSHVSSGVFKKWLSEGVELHVNGLSGQQEIIGLTARDEHFIAKKDGLVQIINPDPFWIGELL
jgi:hypothetical protein